jgi:LysR family transcriptional regulator, cell division regulator
MISSSDLKYFMELARIKHVSRAAERLGVTQPALSYCLNRIEEELGTQLFLRSKKGLELTPAGNRFYQEAKVLEQQWEHLKQSVTDEVESPQGTIRLGCHTAVAQYTLPKFLPKFLKEFPKVNFLFSHGLSRHMTEEVISSKLDVAIAVNPVNHPDLVIKELCKDIVTVWKSKNCLNPNILMVEPSLLQSQDILKKLNSRDIHFDSILESPSLEVIAQLVSSGTGCAILPERVVRAYADKEVEQVKNAPTFNDRICLVYKPNFKKTKRGQIFLEKLFL